MNVVFFPSRFAKLQSLTFWAARGGEDQPQRQVLHTSPHLHLYMTFLFLFLSLHLVRFACKSETPCTDKAAGSTRLTYYREKYSQHVCHSYTSLNPPVFPAHPLYLFLFFHVKPSSSHSSWAACHWADRSRWRWRWRLDCRPRQVNEPCRFLQHWRVAN